MGEGSRNRKILGKIADAEQVISNCLTVSERMNDQRKTDIRMRRLQGLCKGKVNR